MALQNHPLRACKGPELRDREEPWLPHQPAASQAGAYTLGIICTPFVGVPVLGTYLKRHLLGMYLGYLHNVPFSLSCLDHTAQNENARKHHKMSNTVEHHTGCGVG